MRGMNLSARDLRARENQILGIDSAVLAGWILVVVFGLRLFL